MSDWTIYDETSCLLGEGPLWHPGRGELLWFDILGRTLHARGPQGTRRMRLADLSTAAGWIDDGSILMAQRGALLRLDLATGATERLAGLEEGNPGVRPNDGRADPWGGFWIGTMGVKADRGAGAVWRYFDGEVRRLVPGVTIPNAICFHPDRSHALYADTEESTVWRQPLGPDGWPSGEATVFLDLKAAGQHPDGAVMDAEGTAWIALWGLGAVHAFDADGRKVHEVALPAKQTTCPAWGGADLSTLLVTSAAAGIPQADLAAAPEQGRTFAVEGLGRGLPEPRVLA